MGMGKDLLLIYYIPSHEIFRQHGIAWCPRGNSRPQTKTCFGQFLEACQDPQCHPGPTSLRKPAGASSTSSSRSRRTLSKSEKTISRKVPRTDRVVECRCPRNHPIHYKRKRERESSMREIVRTAMALLVEEMDQNRRKIRKGFRCGQG